MITYDHCSLLFHCFSQRDRRVTVLSTKRKPPKKPVPTVVDAKRRREPRIRNRCLNSRRPQASATSSESCWHHRALEEVRHVCVVVYILRQECESCKTKVCRLVVSKERLLLIQIYSLSVPTSILLHNIAHLTSQSECWLPRSRMCGDRSQDLLDNTPGIGMMRP